MGLDKYFWIALFSISAMLVDSFGIWVVYKKCEWADKVKGYCMCFAAGMLITSP